MITNLIKFYIEYDYIHTKRNTYNKMKLLFIIFTVLIQFIYSNKINDPICDVKTPGERFDCYPEDLATKERCLKRGCCWLENIVKLGLDAPRCYFPSNFPSYKVIETKTKINGYSYQIIKTTKTFRENEILNLTVDLIYESNERLRVKITDSNNERYQVPLDVDTNKNKFKNEESSDYYVNIVDEPFAIRVYRKSTQTLMYLKILINYIIL